jgi:hypothetical protein
MMQRSIIGRAALLGLVIAGLALTGCGRRGIPEPPPSVAAEEGRSTALPNDPAKPTGSDEAPKPDQPFILDPLVR